MSLGYVEGSTTGSLIVVNFQLVSKIKMKLQSGKAKLAIRVRVKAIDETQKRNIRQGRSKSP